LFLAPCSFSQTDFPALKQQFLDYRKADKQDSALFIAREMNQLALKEQTDTSYWYALSLRYIGNCYHNFSQIDSTYFYWTSSLKLFEKFHSKNKDYVIVLGQVGLIYSDLGNYKEAEYYLKKSLSLVTNTNDLELVRAKIRILNNLGVLYLDIGDYYGAAQIFEKIIQDNSNSNEISTEILIGPYLNLGISNFYLKNIKAAEHYFLESIKLSSEYFGENTIHSARAFNNWGELYFSKGDLILAKLYFEKSIEIFEKLPNEFLFDKIVGPTIGLTLIRFKQNNFNELSDLFFINNLKNLEDINGQNSSDFHNWEALFSAFLLASQKEKEAVDLMQLVFSKKSKQIADNFEWLNDNQKEAYWQKESAFYDNLSWFAYEAYEKVPEAVGLNYNAALVTKSKMLEAKISSENYYREVDELREELAYRRRLLAKMESDGSTEKDKLEKLRKEADSLDKRLTLSWPEYAQQKKNLTITWDQVQQNLDKGEAAIEFIRYKNEDDSLYYYNALVLKKVDKNPTLVILCKEKDLQSISPIMGYSAYYPLVWQPLEAVLKDVKTIYYAPTGELYNVPFHAIYAPKGKGDEVLAAKTDKRGVIIQNERAATEQNAEYLMDRYTMHQLTSTRYLAMGLKQKAKESIGNTMAMVGGVNYDYLPGSTTVPKKNKKDKNASRSSASASGKLNYLEGTKTEVEQINQQVTASTWQTKLIENNEAIEENITKLEGKEAKGILHLATHGYAFPEYDFSVTTISKNSLRYSYRYSTNPMVRSGLILAGGNWAWTGSDTLSKLGAEQNGILTALEVSQLNLKKTKLVVLSACETGLGKIEGSEGTFGLKRGFKLAGVEQMIVSLWSVPDKETMELMTLFYSDLTKTLNPVLSFEKAQKEMRAKYPTDPDKWAGFVLVR